MVIGVAELIRYCNTVVMLSWYWAVLFLLLWVEYFVSHFAQSHDTNMGHKTNKNFECM